MVCAYETNREEVIALEDKFGEVEKSVCVDRGEKVCVVWEEKRVKYRTEKGIWDSEVCSSRPESLAVVRFYHNRSKVS